MSEISPLTDGIAAGLAARFRSDARILVLGSFPGEASLRAQQYYAHPRNQFWPVMGAIADAIPERPYEERIVALQQAGIALWDVLERCERSGSLDARIRAPVPNNLPDMLAQLPLLRRIVFNGATACALFERHVLPSLPDAHRALPRVRLPSTSPANARAGFETKLEAWRSALSIDERTA